MNSPEFTAALAKKLALSRLEAGIRLDGLLSVITAELANGHVISIANFGNLEVRKRNGSVSVHPSTGKRTLLSPKLVVKFNPSSSFNEKIKELDHE